MQSYKMFYLSGSITKAIQVTLNRKTFYHINFQLCKVNLNPGIKRRSGRNRNCSKIVQFLFIQIYSFYLPRDIKMLGWCPVGPVLPHGEKVPF